MKTIVQGRIIKKYNISLEEIDEFNKEYEIRKTKLSDEGAGLAGRLQSELKVIDFLPSLKIFQTFQNCINDYMITLNHFDQLDKPEMKTKIISCWINDMVENEYNPLHKHNGPHNVGWSCVLFLKVPEFVNDVKHPHKFKDGELCFVSNEGRTSAFKPVVGDFYLFDAGHPHLVNPFKTKVKGAIRRSMSFNLIPDEE